MKNLLELACGFLSACALFAIMLLTFVDVGGRKFFDHSLPGSLELTELLMVVVIFAALPLVSQRGEHVTFDSLDSYLPPLVRKLQARIVHLICALAMLGLGWLMWDTAMQFLSNGETTAQLGLSKAPFIFGMAILCAVTGLVHGWRSLRPTPEIEHVEGNVL